MLPTFFSQELNLKTTLQNERGTNTIYDSFAAIYRAQTHLICIKYQLALFSLVKMNLIDGDHDTELLEAQTHVWNHIFNFINSMTLKCAIQLGIPDIISKHGKPMTLNELVSALTINLSKTRCVIA